jgi:lysophospholipase L1-like esterase
LGLGLVLVGQLACAAKAPLLTKPAPGPRTIHLAGDSTAALFPPGDSRVGWGAVLSDLVEASVDDAARSGRSSKSYRDEGHFRALEARLAVGDLVLIEFGHNDEKPDPARSTDPATTFRDNLRFFVEQSRAHGAYPVLLTPIARRRFLGAAVEQTHGAFPDATRAVALETDTPLIDLTLATTRLLQGLGPGRSAQLFAPDDNTHTNRAGALAVARLVVDGLRALNLAAQRIELGGTALVRGPPIGGT